jgi:hypothetical protein
MADRLVRPDETRTFVVPRKELGPPPPPVVIPSPPPVQPPTPRPQQKGDR